MSFFKQIEGDAAILVENGVYKQVDLYSRDGYIFAKLGSGFVRLMADGSTTKHRLRIDYMSFEGELGSDGLGRLVTAGHPRFKALPTDKQTLLLGPRA